MAALRQAGVMANRLIVLHDVEGFFLRLNQNSPKINVAPPILDEEFFAEECEGESAA